MRRLIFPIIILTALCGILVSACKKNTYHVTERDVITNAALLKIGYFCPSIRNQGVQIKINGNRVSGNVTYAQAFPGGGLNTGGLSNSDYLLTPGNEVNIQLSVPKVGTSDDSVAVLTFSQPLSANKRYTLFTTDSVPNVSGVLVADDTQPSDTGARIKLINLIPNVAAVDFYHRGKLIMPNVQYKKVSDYVNIPFGSDTFAIRNAGDPITAPVIAFRVIATSRQRIYTFLGRGWKGAAGTLAPQVSAVIVQ